MSAGIACGGQALSFAARQPNAIQVRLGGVVRRSREIEPPAFIVNRFDRNHIELAAGDQARFFALKRYSPGMAPAVALAEPDQLFAFAEPPGGIVVVHPSGIALDQ